jgi:hypothetical protein
MNVHDSAAKPCDQAGAEDLHESGEDDQLDAVRVEPVGQRVVSRRAVLVVLHGEDARLYTGVARAGQSLRVRLVRRYAHDLDPVAAVDLVEQRLQVRAGP